MMVARAGRSARGRLRCRIFMVESDREAGRSQLRRSKRARSPEYREAR